MSKFNINDLIKKKQNKYFSWGLSITSVIVFSSIVLINIDDEPSNKKDQSTPNMTGSPIDESFTESNAESAISAIQLESKDTVKLVKGFEYRLKKIEDANNKKIDDLKALIQDGFKKQKEEQKKGANHVAQVKNAEFWHNANATVMPQQPFQAVSPNQVLLPLNSTHTEVEHYKWSYETKAQKKHYKKTIKNYIPSGSYASAIVLLGADADASVNGQSSSQPMTFKLTSAAHLPNNRRTDIEGCFLTVNTYGDVSSERAYARLEKFSCAMPGKPIIDKKVDGWISFKGKVGIKGKISMRDGKVLTWAGISGALSGFASIAQASQAVQSISPLGSTQTIPSNKMFNAGGYAGAANAMDRLSNYYIKRADQYHPIVQVGSGNEVEVVFKDGFFLYDDEDKPTKGKNTQELSQVKQVDPEFIDPNTFSVNQTVLDQMDRTNRLSLGQKVEG